MGNLLPLTEIRSIWFCWSTFFGRFGYWIYVLFWFKMHRNLICKYNEVKCYNYIGFFWLCIKRQSPFGWVLLFLNIITRVAWISKKTIKTCIRRTCVYLAKPTPLLTPFASLSILVEMTCPKGFSIFSSSCSSIEMGRFEM